MSADKVKLESKNQESNKDTKNELPENSSVSKVMSEILSSVEFAEKIGTIENSCLKTEGQDLCKDVNQRNDRKRKIDTCEKVAKSTLTEFRKIASMLMEMRVDNKELDKKLSLKKICQMLEKMNLHDSQTAQLSDNSKLRELALETDIIIGKLKKLEKKPDISDREILKKVKIISLYGFEKIFRILRILIRQLNKEGKQKI